MFHGTGICKSCPPNWATWAICDCCWPMFASLCVNLDARDAQLHGANNAVQGRQLKFPWILACGDREHDKSLGVVGDVGSDTSENFLEEVV